MIGALFGDIVGSVHERSRTNTTRFPLLVPASRFTDDSVLTIATAHALLTGEPFDTAYRSWALRYPHAGYGGAFKKWMNTPDAPPYNSWGNGSAMRVSSVGFAYDNLDAVMMEAQRSAEVTHKHPEGIKGAQATAVAIFMARKGQSKSQIKTAIAKSFGYDLNRTVDEIRPTYVFNESCQETVPEAIIAFLESNDFEDAIRNAISLGGDSDTLTCITGSLAEAFYGGVPKAIAEKALSYLDPNMCEVVKQFYGSLSQSKADQT